MYQGNLVSKFAKSQRVKSLPVFIDLINDKILCNK